MDWMFPDAYHRVKVEDLAKSMVRNAEIDGKGVEILDYSHFKQFI